MWGTKGKVSFVSLKQQVLRDVGVSHQKSGSELRPSRKGFSLWRGGSKEHEEGRCRTHRTPMGQLRGVVPGMSVGARPHRHEGAHVWAV